MNRAFLFLATLAVLMLFCGQIFSRDRSPSEEMARILIHYKSGPHKLDVRKLPLDQAMNFPSEKKMTEYEVYHVPYPKGMADYFEYAVLLHTLTGRYWLHLSGGAGGVSEFYGPGQLKDLPKP